MNPPTFTPDRFGKIIVAKSGVLRVEVVCISGDTERTVLEMATIAIKATMAQRAREAAADGGF